MRRTTRVAVLGAGIQGLTVALRLIKEGYPNVTIFSKEEITKTNSAKATASWYIPPDKQPILQQLCIDSYLKLIELSKIPGTGVSIDTPIYHFRTQKEFDQSIWAKKEVQKLLSLSFKLPGNYKPLGDFPVAFTAKIPVIIPEIHLKYLLKEFISLGGRFYIKEIDNIESLSAQFKVIINCTGWEAQKITKDPFVVPIRGHLEVGKISGNFYSLHYPGLNAYTVIRQETQECVLGTTYQVNEKNTEINLTDKAEILKKCSAFFPVKELGETISQVGIRCGREPDVRIEAEVLDGCTIIHCYGHGGCGFSAAWGSACKVLELCDKLPSFRCKL